jgi:hypothetical protein
MDTPRVLMGSHEELETMERKIEWFLGMTFEERYAVLQELLEFVYQARPNVLRCERAPDPLRSVRVVSLPHD